MDDVLRNMVIFSVSITYDPHIRPAFKRIIGAAEVSPLNPGSEKKFQKLIQIFYLILIQYYSRNRHKICNF
jgi:hypothetical protein